MTASVPQIDFTELGPERRFSQPAKRIFVTVTSIWVAATVSVMLLFYVGVLDFIN
ncbi:hypothetical protein [Halioglobus sp. HI00S01]|uniref:hypothetical protein n=1 Tax=Halioglobus sp. HI00S01 TaxID=1822214 RepID=UPI0012E82990|nr:hypothetical protein [Halioglobus sp. HI00S01]